MVLIILGGSTKMKRLKITSECILRSFACWTVLAIFLSCMVAVCLGQRRSRNALLMIRELPEPRLTGSCNLEEAIAKQRIIRQLTNQPLKYEQIGQLAWAGQGKQEQLPQTVPQTSAPAGSAAVPIEQPAQEIYPVRLYFATPDGVHLYNPDGHRLEQTSEQDVRGALAGAVANPQAVSSAGCDIIIVGPIRDPAGRAATVARRISLLQAGQTAQNIQIQAAGLGLASVPVSNFDPRNVTKICNIPRSMEALYIISVGYPAESISAASTTGQQPATVQSSQNIAKPKKAVLIVASENFNERELFDTLRVFTASGIQNFIASTRTGFIKGAQGRGAEAKILLSQLNVDDYDAVVFIGGEGARGYFNNPAALNIAREAAGRGKVLAAISTAPSILANAGVLRGVRATGMISEGPLLQLAGAIYTGTLVERQGFIITASGPEASVQFAGVIIEALSGR
jgi:protease I